MTFSTIKQSVFNRFNANSNEELFTTGLGHRILFDAYLAALPEEDRQHHNCNCCKSFLNQFGDIVWITDGVVHSMWEFEGEGIYKDVPKALHNLVISQPIQGAFKQDNLSLGTDHNFDKHGNRWEHFHVDLPQKHKGGDSTKGHIRANHDVFKRALETLTLEAVDQVIELINGNNLYRGAEKLRVLQEFRSHLAQAALYAWEHHRAACTRIRNDVIGTLLVDISEGLPLDRAVAIYEAKVAPTNYRRPTALVTASMLEAAKTHLESEGLLGPLQRRHATVDDIPVAKTLWVNRPVTQQVDVFEELKSDLPFDLRKAKLEDIKIGEFLRTLKGVDQFEALFEPRLVGNLVNLTEAVDPEAQPLFHWNTSLGWAYRGGTADSVKERVKAAGGKVDGDVRISLSWYNHDDLDLHIYEPNGYHIYFSVRGQPSPNTGGMLDVDMNAGHGTTRTPVENITYPTMGRMKDGEYKVWVKNYHKRESSDVGFSVEVEIMGQTVVCTYDKAVPDGANVEVGVITVKKGQAVFTPLLPCSDSSTAAGVEICGLKGYRFHPVNMVVPSPNTWFEVEVKGNAHLFFLMDDAHADADVRGFFNEYLHPRLETHRKVFEMLGNKVTIPATGQQLAGLGFSSTMRNNLVVRAKIDGKQRLFNVQF
jgi:hypothetical protein